MNVLQVKNKLKKTPVFSLDELRLLFPGFSRIQLNRWQSQGYINKIIRKYYIFADEEVNENILFLMANKIYDPSYVSFEMALSYYSLIPESVFTITSASSRPTYEFSTKFGTFRYKKIRPDLFWGYKVVRYKSFFFKIAELEKALLDYFYLNSHLNSIEHFEELRINIDSLNENFSKEKFEKYLLAFNNKRLTKSMNIFINYLENA